MLEEENVAVVFVELYKNERATNAKMGARGEGYHSNLGALAERSKKSSELAAHQIRGTDPAVKNRLINSEDLSCLSLFGTTLALGT